MDRSLKQYPMDKTVLYPAYHTASLTGLLAPLYCTGHSLGGQIAILASLHLLQNARHLSCSGGAQLLDFWVPALRAVLFILHFSDRTASLPPT